MRARMSKLAARIDALSLRERAFLFVATMACCMVLADVVWITPAQNTYKQVTSRFAAQNDELARLRAELQTMGSMADPGKTVRDELAATDANLAAINLAIASAAPAADKGPDLAQVLTQFLRRQEGLTLVSTGTLNGSAANAASDAVLVPGMAKRGVELRVAGSYAELTRYVRSLEVALPAVRWGQLVLKSEKQPPELTLQVYVVGVSP